MPAGMYHEILFSRGSIPVFGILGPPTSIASPYVPIEQLSVAAILTQMGWLMGRALRVVENPMTLVLYNHFPFSTPYWTINVSIPEYGPQLIKILSASTLFDFIMIGAI